VLLEKVYQYLGCLLPLVICQGHSMEYPMGIVVAASNSTAAKTLSKTSSWAGLKTQQS
jgi:hypothetical protein